MVDQQFKSSKNATLSTESEKKAARKPTRLGRGLSTLMAQPIPVVAVTNPEKLSAAPALRQPDHQGNANLNRANSTPQDPDVDSVDSSSTDKLLYLPIDGIKANPHQPRQKFEDEALGQLASSIRTDGLIQPIVVRPRKDYASTTSLDGGKELASPKYELVAGERRWRAAQLAGLNELPAIVRDLNDQQIAEWALIENLQREDLNPIERAKAFQRLIDQFQMSHEQIAQRVGVERPTISNSIRLLNLCDFAQGLVQDGLLSAGQAKALAGIGDSQQQKIMAQRTVTQGWTVRQVEQEIRRLGERASDPTMGKPTKLDKTNAHLRDLEQRLGQALQTKVKLKSGRKKGAGTLSIEYYSLDQFDDLMQRLNVGVQAD